MINIPTDFSNNGLTDKKFKELVALFNNLEKDLEYPNCEGNADKNRILARFENELIMRGFL